MRAMKTRLPPNYVISLDRSAGRLRHFRERNSHIEAIRISAVDGSSLDRSALEKSGVIAADLPYEAGSLGCALSHMGMWEMALAQNRAVTILEDDAVVSHQFEKEASEILGTLPADWDFIMWGSNLPPAFAWVDIGLCKVKLHDYGHSAIMEAKASRNSRQRRSAPALCGCFIHLAFADIRFR